MRSAGPDPYGADVPAHEPAEWMRAGTALLDPTLALAVLQQACAPSGWNVLEVLQIDPIQERPERRRTLRYHVVAARGLGPAKAVTWFAKQYASKKGSRVADLLGALHARSSLGAELAYAVPDVVTYSGDLRLLITAELRGPTLEAWLGQSLDRDLCSCGEGIGRALACVHDSLASPTDAGAALTAHGPVEEAGIVNDALDRALVAGWPDALVGRFSAAASWIRDRLRGPLASWQRGRTLHRDLHPGQIVPGEPVGFLDWDAASWGEPELDVGNLEAHFILDDHRRGRRGADRISSTLGRALRRGYASHRAFDHGRHSVYVAAALLRLASLERLAERRISVVCWPELARKLVDEAIDRL